MTTRKLIQREAKDLKMEEIKSAIGILQGMINESEKYRNSYFWYPHSTSRGRNYAGFNHSYHVFIGDVQITFESSYSESCRNCYYQKSIFVNEATTTLTTVKTVLDELEKIMDAVIPD
jgi:hypothetical protein